MRYKPNYQRYSYYNHWYTLLILSLLISNVESKVDKTLPPYTSKPHPLTAPPQYQDVLKVY